MPDEAYPATGFRTTPNGCMTEEAFCDWFKYLFLKNCPKERPILETGEHHITQITAPHDTYVTVSGQFLC